VFELCTPHDHETTYHRGILGRKRTTDEKYVWKYVHKGTIAHTHSYMVLDHKDIIMANGTLDWTEKSTKEKEKNLTQPRPHDKEH